MFGVTEAKTSFPGVLDKLNDAAERLSRISKIEIVLPFKNTGECSDEVVLSFDDGQKLYVSENFLCYASPVFKAMFTHDCKEKESKEVAMKEKVSDDFLEFLLCLHPGVQKPIDNDNVLRVVSFAEEYQVDVSVKRCQNVMKSWLLSEAESAFKVKDNLKKAKYAKTCLNILLKAQACGFEELVTHATQVIAKFGHEVFTGSMPQGLSVHQSQEFGKSIFGTPALSSANSVLSQEFGTPRFGTPAVSNAKSIQSHEFGTPLFGTPAVSNAKSIQSQEFGTVTPLFGTPAVQYANSVQSTKSQHDGSNVSKPVSHIEECKKLYESLPEELKTRLLLQRLILCDDGKMR